MRTWKGIDVLKYFSVYVRVTVLYTVSDDIPLWIVDTPLIWCYEG